MSVGGGEHGPAIVNVPPSNGTYGGGEHGPAIVNVPPSGGTRS